MAALRALQMKDLLEQLALDGDDVAPTPDATKATGTNTKDRPAECLVANAFRELGANLMRLARGTGRPDAAIVQIAALGDLLAEFEATSGLPYPSESVSRALRISEIMGNSDDCWSDWDRAMLAVIEGALQVAASELLGQHPQSAAGKKQLFAGNREVEKLHRRELGRMLRR